ncbi:MAG: TIGR02281 family clan AA aspartic protease [Asticcacaulis sp.]|nr:TIGR02281 family clan AA aspartic protease [Asticcacaulis sp.]
MLKSAFVMGSAIVTAIVASTAMLLIDNRMRSDDNQPPAAPIVMAAQDQPSGADGRITAIPKSGDGHFWATALVNEKAVRFLVDTGATEVVLTPSDAQRLGFDASNLTYDQKVVTANGQTVAALVTLTTVGIGRSEISNVDALVVKDGLSTSLLGMSYLGRLSRIEATPSSLVLHP